MAQEENKKAKHTAQSQPDVTDLQTQPDVTDLTDWDNTQVRGTYVKKGAHPNDLEKR